MPREATLFDSADGSVLKGYRLFSEVERTFRRCGFSGLPSRDAGCIRMLHKRFVE
jgi:hypothetical protein